MPKSFYDYTKLKKRMKDMRYTQTTLAREVPMDRQTLNTKLSHRSMFKQNEISGIARVLDIDAEELGSYFFTLIVRKDRQMLGSEEKSKSSTRIKDS
ncbi:DUF739 family protein [Limosilactobacillus reuteri]|jgi:hypothetical protein|uniref:DUF739 family protein n=1 Tax=Limosilactobacillus reuteri TaxID=1598 RepID=A0A256VJ19_LIMRT|nr:DUF739 family protein [Limosilactobacillus reuteri]OYS59679.1 hypothetical protein CBF88_05185 [Limosilactobacillus reuteri]OYS61270.1 hypothetical protein CBF91_05810 [Limosilactobacillus reuteri]OYS64441.1 hypothetical protein CBF89_05560 [Limosilactobacillus reuteri]OYS72478.1 hypothetical protein CBG01_05480 [Limosilactobacillus reuteri]OYS75044.1 hypothetical protein CBG08_05415 [Limosilactobacillus reuteri]